jgi:hypothetical protein
MSAVRPVTGSCCIGVTKALQRRHKVVTKVFKKCSKDLTTVLRGCFGAGATHDLLKRNISSHATNRGRNEGGGPREN